MLMFRTVLKVVGAILLVTPFSIVVGCHSENTPTRTSPLPVHTNRTLVWWQRPGVRGGATTFAKSDPGPLAAVGSSTTFENATDSLVVSYRLVGVEQNAGQNVDIYEFDLTPNGAGPVQRPVRYTGGSTVVYEDNSAGTSLTIEPGPL